MKRNKHPVPPHSPFTTPFSPTAQEMGLRLRSLFQWKKKRPPLAVLGLVMVAVNLLGAGATTGEKSGEGTRERTDEAVEGELPGPLDTTRGEPARRRRVGVGTAHLTAGTKPREAGRR